MWKPMQGKSGERGDVLIEVWKSKKVPWHWIALYRYNEARKTLPKPVISWSFRGRYYDLVWHK